MAAYIKGYAYEYWVVSPSSMVKETGNVDRVVTDKKMYKLHTHLAAYLSMHCECDPLSQSKEFEIYMTDDGFESLEDAQEAFNSIDSAVKFILNSY